MGRVVDLQTTAIKLIVVLTSVLRIGMSASWLNVVGDRIAILARTYLLFCSASFMMNEETEP